MKSTPFLAQRWAGIVTALFCAILWGTAFPAVKAGLNFFTPAIFAGARFTLGGLAVLGLAAATTGLRKRTAGSWRAVLLIGLLHIAIGYWLFFQAMNRISGSTGAILNSSGPIMTAILARLLLRESRWRRSQVLGVAIGFLGTVLALIKPGWRPDFSWRGEGVMLLSTLVMSYAAILSKRACAFVDASLLAGGSMLFGGSVLLAGGLMAEPLAAQRVTANSLLIFLYTALLSAVAFTLWYAVLRWHEVALISSTKFAIPIVGAALSALLLGEPFTVFKAIGGLLVAIGIWLIFAPLGQPSGGQPADTWCEPPSS